MFSEFPLYHTQFLKFIVDTFPCLQEPSAALFLHVGLINPRGVLLAVRSILNSMGTKRNLCNKYYTTSDGRLSETLRAILSSHGFVHKPAAPHFDRLVRNETLVYEFPTLHQLWLHCKEDSPITSVIYMHTLGSHKSWSLRRHLTRRVLQGQVLHGGGKECADLPGKWHCGPNPNFSRCWEHYSGNFWRASCSHVNSLREPSLGEAGFVQAMQMGSGHGDSEKCAPHGPLGRYWAEAWIVHGGTSDHSRKQHLTPIRGTGDASVFHWLVHQLFFRYRVNVVYLIDKVAFLAGISW